MPIKISRISLYTLAAWLAIGLAAKAETTTVSGPRPVARAALKLEDIYGWAITYEDLPLVHNSDIRDATSATRKDGKHFGEAGVMQVLVPRGGSFSFSFDPPYRREPGTRAPEEATRAAILDMLKSYSLSIGGMEVFTLTDSNGLFHIVPVQRKGGLGTWEKITPLLDTQVTIPPGQRSGKQLLDEICRSLATQSGVRVSLFVAGAINFLNQRKTQIASAPHETARSLLTRFFAEVATPRPVTWHLDYEPSWGYALSMRILDEQVPDALSPR